VELKDRKYGNGLQKMDVKWHFSFNSLGFGLQILVVLLAWQQFLNKIMFSIYIVKKRAAYHRKILCLNKNFNIYYLRHICNVIT